MSAFAKLSKDVWRQSFFDDQIIAYKVLNAHRATIDIWIDACAADMEQMFRAGKPLLMLQDLSSRQFGQSPYSRARGAELTNAFPELHGRVGLILPPDPDSMRLRLFLKRDSNQKTRQRAAFLTWDDAMRWLMEPLNLEDTVEIPPQAW